MKNERKFRRMIAASLIASSLIFVPDVYYKLQDYNKAIEVCNMAIQSFTNENVKRDFYRQIAEYYEASGDKLKTQDYRNKANSI